MSISTFKSNVISTQFRRRVSTSIQRVCNVHVPVGKHLSTAYNHQRPEDPPKQRSVKAVCLFVYRAPAYVCQKVMGGFGLESDTVMGNAIKKVTVKMVDVTLEHKTVN